jgi:hypothetical protein
MIIMCKIESNFHHIHAYMPIVPPVVKRGVERRRLQTWRGEAVMLTTVSRGPRLTYPVN